MKITIHDTKSPIAGTNGCYWMVIAPTHRSFGGHCASNQDFEKPLTLKGTMHQYEPLFIQYSSIILGHSSWFLYNNSMVPCDSPLWNGCFLKYRVPLNHPFLDGIFPSSPAILGYPHDYGHPHVIPINPYNPYNPYKSFTNPSFIPINPHKIL